MKKITSLLLCCVLAGMLCSCDSDSSERHSDNTVRTTTAVTVKENKSYYWYSDSADARREADKIKDKYFDEHFSQKAGVRNGKPVTQKGR